MAKGYLYDNGDELITREDVNEVPDSSSAHAGDVLELDSNKKPKWSTPESELPSTGSASVGDVLTLDEDKDPVWSAPSGGGDFSPIIATFSQGQIGFLKTFPVTSQDDVYTFAELAEMGTFYFVINGDDEFETGGPVYKCVIDGNEIDGGVFSVPTYNSSPSTVNLAFYALRAEVADPTTKLFNLYTGGTVNYSAPA